jgi:hypothetical protein
MFECFVQHCFICCPSESTLSEDADIESRAVATHLKTRGVVIEMTPIEQYLALFEHQLMEAEGRGDVGNCVQLYCICMKMLLHYSKQ